LLIVGNDLGVWVSNDAGEAWSRLTANLPTVAVHDLTVHPRENDLVLGTYGRGIWIGDITALQQARPATLSGPVHVFDIEPRPFYGYRAIGNYDLFGDKYIQVPNEPDALVIRYWLREKTSAPAKITIADASGKVINELTGPSEAGLNQVLWNMRPAPPSSPGERRFSTAPPMLPGDYRITIEVAEQTVTKAATIRPRVEPAPRR
ncbi:MAG: hypothetical protein M3Q55_17040, partial [Acidobacteriota bacterium]|nr:hypothetical protein [Acidobacteriota bacterium]